MAGRLLVWGTGALFEAVELGLEIGSGSRLVGSVVGSGDSSGASSIVKEEDARRRFDQIR
jgi:hypothetical protein